MLTYPYLQNTELERYARHLKLPGFGLSGQSSLLNSNVLLIGAGGLGCPIGIYLAASGIGKIGIVDSDCVDLSNLQRQVAFQSSQIGQPKAATLAERMQAINPELTYEFHNLRLNESNVETIISGYDLVIDGSDNFATKFLVSDACFLNQIPLLQGAIYQFEAQALLVIPNKTPCYRCLFSMPPQSDALKSCVEIGVLGVVAGMGGLIMATEAVKYLSATGETIAGQLLRYDALKQEIKKTKLSFDENCNLCGTNRTITSVKSTALFECIDSSASDDMLPSISSSQAKQLIASGATLVDVREKDEYQNGHIAEAISLPLSQLNSHAAIFPDKSQTLIVYCQLGERSQTATAKLRQLGYQKAFNLTGGIGSW